jgi:NAD(P)-dependent dehydrogenase (short-subunit alcohol dehydrogenase family)
VFAGVRREEDAAALREAGSERLEPLILDVTDAAQIDAAAGRVGEAVGEAGLDGLVNNAGVAVPGPLEALPIDDFRRQVEVNLTAQVAVTQALLPRIRTARGRIVFVTSIGGLMAFPMFGAYHAAKFGLEAVGDVFRRELRPWGISVSVVEPGSIDTSIWERGQREADGFLDRATDGQKALYADSIAAYREVARRTAERGIPPRKVARRIEHALGARRPRTRYLVGADARAQAFFNRLLPDRAVDALVARFTGM